MSIKNVQWLAAATVPPLVDIGLDASHRMNPTGEVFPFAVPPDHWLAVTDATIQAALESIISPYFVVNGLFALPNQTGAYSWEVPLIVLPGTELTAGLINNATEAQWISVSLHGLLVPKTSDDYRDVWAKIRGT